MGRVELESHVRSAACPPSPSWNTWHVSQDMIHVCLCSLCDCQLWFSIMDDASHWNMLHCNLHCTQSLQSETEKNKFIFNNCCKTQWFLTQLVALFETSLLIRLECDWVAPILTRQIKQKNVKNNAKSSNADKSNNVLLHHKLHFVEFGKNWNLALKNEFNVFPRTVNRNSKLQLRE